MATNFLTITKEQLQTSPNGREYSAQVSGRGIPFLLKKVHINIELENDEDPSIVDSLLTIANDMLQKLDVYAAKATEELYELFNDEWNEEGEEVSKEDFAKRLKLESLIVKSSSRLVYFDDGELFCGHVIEVNIDNEGNVESADIAG
ncbi:predicted protein [Naegleria gruberi]|uniref:Predicted protein n=1 Tax=Naegleria gruberi TaxID=5762 RepID=D2W2A8_NAEGR|nr:uncharacterized protein NAEGRDRAFT_54150 [Naegleria gruberi]EFC36792.1 predicted protein [Naegleria gruberi]|eukprot:XP_002669536.1 predicted protein [Naegleria gruberi strain NEG-M]